MSTIKSNHLNKTWLAVTAASALALTGCATDSGKASAEKRHSDSGGTLKIGLLTSMSGSAGLFGPADPERRGTGGPGDSTPPAGCSVAR